MSDDDPTVGREAASSRLLHLRAAQLRARAIRWAIGKSVLGIVFLVGALAYALGPERDLASSRAWMTILVVLSTFNVGLGLRTFARVRRQTGRYWPWATALWGLLATGLIRILVAR